METMFVLSCCVGVLTLAVVVLAVRIMTHAEKAQAGLQVAQTQAAAVVERLAEKIISDQGTLANHSRERVAPRQNSTFPVQYRNPWEDPDSVSEAGPSFTVGGENRPA